MKNKKIAIISGVCILIICGFFLALQTNFFGRLPNYSNKRTITTSFYPLYYFTEQIAGNKLSVVNITPSGAEPHDYEPTASDIITIEKSQLLIINGAKLEAWGDKISNQLANTSTKVVVASREITTNNYLDENGNKTTDPHIWLDPKLAKQEAKNIATAIYKIDPSNMAYYKDNLKKLDETLNELDSDYKLGLSDCSNKNIVTSHAAFGYLANDYGLKQISISGLSPDAEPSPDKLAEIANFAKENNVKYIFFESLTSPKLSQTIASEVGAKTMVLNPLEGLTPAEKNAGKDYVSIMKDNLNNLKIALECK